MYDLGDELRQALDHVRVGSGQFGARDGIVGTVEEKEGDEGPEALDEEADDEAVDEQEEDDLPPHVSRLLYLITGGADLRVEGSRVEGRG